MRQIPSPIRFLGQALLWASTSLLVACPGPRSKQNGPAPAPAFPAKAAGCEDQIRRQMLDKSLNLQSIPELADQIAGANQAFQGNAIFTYKVTQGLQGSISDIAVLASGPDRFNGTDVEYTLGLPDKDVNAVFVLKIETLTIHGLPGQEKSAAQLTQNFNVSEECTLNLISTETEEYQGTSKVEYTAKTYFAEGAPSEGRDQFTVPPNSMFTGYMLGELPDLGTWPQVISDYSPGIGLLVGDVDKNADETKTAFGIPSVFQRVDTILKDGDNPLGTLKFGQDLKSGVRYMDLLGDTSWSLPLETWSGVRIGSDRSSSDRVKSELTSDYLYANWKIDLVAPKAPAYPHFSAYWSTQSTSAADSAGNVTLRLIENGDPSYKDEAVAADLASNDTIQTELPEVQAIVKTIISSTPDDRRQRIQKILDYLDSNFPYDYSMLNSGAIRSLSTAEALAAGKGVCQHFAVIFTALARAMKIPSRIVVGYLLSDSPGAHAWVEAEVEPGLWRVIEPQRKAGLTATHTRFYYPQARGWYLEDQRVGQGEYAAIYMAEVLTFKQVAP